MMVASEADDAWCPPTLRPSWLGRRWLAWWMVQAASHSTFCSSARSRASASAAGGAELVGDLVGGLAMAASSHWRLGSGRQFRSQFGVRLAYIAELGRKR